MALYAAMPMAQAQTTAATESVRQYDIPAGSLSTALSAWGAQSDRQLVFAPDLIAGKQSRRVSGHYGAEQALTQLLAGTGLAWERVDGQTYTIKRKPQSPASTGQKRPSRPKAPPTATQKIVTLSTVTVTGSQIVGVHDIASPLQVYTREDIDQTGAGSVQRFIQTLPQNFQGGAWEGSVSELSGGGGANNGVGGTGVNLRGLGNDATLVLLNGHRIAPGNGDGNFVDVSLIPATALDRVEVMPDGASALYGSDAVGGVVNFITRKDYQGAETRIRYGGVTEGKLDEYQFAQTFGKAWGSGSALLSYEYLQQSPLSLNDKSWVRDKFPGPYDILPEQKRHALFASIDQSVGDDVELYGDATFANRRMPNDWFSFSSTQQNMQADINAWSADGGARVALPHDFQFETDASYATSDTGLTITNLGQGTVGRAQVNTEVFAWDTKLSGNLFHLPAGEVQFTAGMDYQKESYTKVNKLNAKASYAGNRNVWAAFTEVRIPLADAGAAGSSLPGLEMTLAGRYEHYSDFGSTANPKVGLIWRPSTGFKFRGTWGKSFVAPLLSQLNPVPVQVAALLIPDPLANPSGTNVPGIFIFGGNPDLKPQKAKTWTLGFDWTSQGLAGLRANATYYNIDYTNRITNPQEAFTGVVSSSLDPLDYENLLGQFITRNPSPAMVQQFVDTTSEFDDFTGIPGGVDLSSIAALVDYRNANLAAVRTSGVDFGTAYLWHPGTGSMEVGLDGTYILKFDNLLALGVPVVEAADTVFHPANLKLRARWTFNAGPFNGALFVNYVDSYRDTRSIPSVPVASWTTIDANLGYRFEHQKGLLAGTSLTLGMINLTDRAPPYVAPSYGTLPGYSSIDFDGANADVRGRFIYVQAVKRF